MTTLECAETQEHAPEFALGILHGGARAARATEVLAETRRGACQRRGRVTLAVRGNLMH